MNDDTKIVNQNPDLVSAVPAQPQAPVGLPNKEMGPISITPVSEFVKPSEIEPQIDKDLAELGVEAKKDKPELTDEHRLAGIEHSGIYVPTPSVSSSSVKLPMTEEEMTDKLKRGQDDDSGKWLAGLIKKIISVMSTGIGS